MPRRIGTLVVSFGVMLAAGCTAQRGGARLREPVPYQAEPWSYQDHHGRKIATAHYEVFTTLRNENLLGVLPDVVEAIFHHCQQLVPPTQAPVEKMQVYLFAGRPDWERFTRDFTGPRAKEFLQVRYGGYTERGVVVIEYTANQTTFPIMAHEGCHQYLYHYVNGEIPAWLHEGLAVYCEGIRWRGSRIDQFDPWHNPLRRNTLADAVVRKRLLSLDELLETHAGRIVQRGPRTTGTYYAQLWGLILFLREGQNGKYAANFARLLSHLEPAELQRHARAAYIWSGRGDYNAGEALFRSFITEDLQTFEREYTDFVRQRVLGGRRA